MAKLTQQKLKRLLRYDRHTGLFSWRHRPANCIQIGDPAGSYDGRRWNIQIGKKIYRAHHLAWLYVHGYKPRYLDHIDGNSSNNAISNLRKATHAQNHMNQKRRVDNKVGLKGVTIFENRFRANIRVNGKPKHLGLFKTAKEAHKAYCKAARDIYGEFARFE